MIDCSKLAGVHWKQMAAPDKEQYEELAQKDKLRQERQEEELEEKEYFTMADGSKSTDLENSVWIKMDMQPKRTISAY